jgi:hypothetical protein
MQEFTYQNRFKENIIIIHFYYGYLMFLVGFIYLIVVLIFKIILLSLRGDLSS